MDVIYNLNLLFNFNFVPINCYFFDIKRSGFEIVPSGKRERARFFKMVTDSAITAVDH